MRRVNKRERANIVATRETELKSKLFFFLSVSDGFVAFCIHFQFANVKTNRQRAHNLIFKFDGNLYVISMLHQHIYRKYMRRSLIY